ncbi:ligase-associated DNA damage response exonuclease [Oceanibium sediminis]|uniref:ligase-associated DNA damage response exonuclease n=1 Tax=Oceanibium sediminis TaxID=2026339 RepID=UPI000DD397A2|nr:ligase-associated DNA damage response exonuclease [Oceanibium sediminis]
MTPDALLHPRPEGLYCPAGDFHIDPVRPVARALITHGHADHARAGHGAVMATRRTLDVMAIRYGAGFAGSTQVPEGVVEVNGVRVSFHPAGHVLGSAQIRVEKDGVSVVAAGDYKRLADPTAEVFEPVRGTVFITEATFGLPVFRHPNPQAEIGKLLTSLTRFPERAHMVGVYALGKAQRVIRLIRDAGYDAPLYIHGALKKLCDYYEGEGIALGPLLPATSDAEPKDFAGRIVLAPPSAFAAKWGQRFPDPLICFASGWMQVRARARQRGVELPLVISDHCDWGELTDTITELDPEEVWVTHGREEALVRWCALNQRAARPLHLVGYEDEAEE